MFVFNKKIDFFFFPQKGLGVIAKMNIMSGELVCTGRAIEFDVKRDSHSFQIDNNTHVQLDEPGRSFNHSCQPNLRLASNRYKAYDFYALRNIKAGEELVWHYGMTEAVSIAVRECKCGAPNCFGRSVGFKEAPIALQKTIYRWGCADYLKIWFNKNAL